MSEINYDKRISLILISFIICLYSALIVYMIIFGCIYLFLDWEAPFFINTLLFGAPLVFAHLVMNRYVRCAVCGKSIYAFPDQSSDEYLFLVRAYNVLIKRKFSCPNCHQKYKL